MNEYQTKKQLREKIASLELNLQHETKMREKYELREESARERLKDERLVHEKEIASVREAYANLLDGLVFLMEEAGVAEHYVKVTPFFRLGGEYHPKETVEIEKFLSDVKTVREAVSAKDARKRLGIKKGSDNGN